LYFQDWEDRQEVAELVATSRERRPPQRHRLVHAILDRIEGDHKVYKVVPAEEAKSAEESMAHTAAVLPVPSAWPALLSWRSGGIVYDSGSGAGFLRRATRGQAQATRKLRVRS
jgi:hypothetical protein